MRRFPACFLASTLLGMVGCGEANENARYAAYKTTEEPAPAPMTPPAEAAASARSRGMMGGGMMGADAAVDKDRAAPPAPEGVSRKVIYDAALDLAVEDVDAAAAKVDALLASSGGYIAEETMAGSPGSNRSRFWKLRIPIDDFDGFVKSVMALGELVRFNRTSQDVTAEFYDVEARIKNKQVQEGTLQKMLEERSGALDEVLKVETELSRVRGEIEQMEGRIRVLKNLTSLATLTLTLSERERFQPPAPVVADFPTQIARTWRASVDRLVEVGQALVLFAVAQGPWLPFWAVGLLIAWLVVRRVARLARPRPAPPARHSPGE